jgi:hypothetical protein
MAEAEVAVNSDVLYCTVHPTVETTLRCNKCGRPMCIKCSRRTPVGYRCKECVKGQQAVFYTAQGSDVVIQAVVTLVLGTIAGLIAGFVGGMMGFWAFYIMIPAGGAVGAFITDMALRATGRRRGRFTWLVIPACIALGALIASPMALFTQPIGLLIYGFTATSTALGTLRFRQR